MVLLFRNILSSNRVELTNKRLKVLKKIKQLESGLMILLKNIAIE